MRGTTPGFLDAVVQPHTVVSKVLVEGFELGAVVGGSVTLDLNAEIRGRAEVSIVADPALGLVPDSPADLLTPYGREFQVFRGIQYLDGSEELVALGVYRIESVDVSDAGAEVQIALSGLDRAQRIADNAFTAPYSVAAGTNVITAIEDTLSDTSEEFETDFPTTAEVVHVTPLLIAEEGESRWTFVQGIAKWIGADLYFDGDGVLVLRPTASQASPVLEIAEGEDGVLVEAARAWSREGIANRIIVSGENTGTDTVFRADVRDEDSSSPTYYDGVSSSTNVAFGRVPLFFSSEFITSQDQAEVAAPALLERHRGLSQSVSFGAIVNPALEPGDVVRITRERLGIDGEDHIIDSITFPLDVAGTMTAETRAIGVGATTAPPNELPDEGEATFFLDLESGDAALLESGDQLLAEDG